MVAWWFRATSTQLRGSPQRKPPLAVLYEWKRKKTNKENSDWGIDILNGFCLGTSRAVRIAAFLLSLTHDVTVKPCKRKMCRKPSCCEYRRRCRVACALGGRPRI